MKDLQEKFKVSGEITQKHIDEGEAESCKRCPLAISLEEAMGDKYNRYDVYVEKTAVKAWPKRSIRGMLLRVLSTQSLYKAILP